MSQGPWPCHCEGPWFSSEVVPLIRYVGICVNPPLGGRSDENSRKSLIIIQSVPCKNPCRVFIHDNLFGPLGLHLLVWNELGRSWPFQLMRDLRANSHTSQEPWAWNCESPKESVQRPSQTHLQNHVVWSHTLKCNVKSYVTGPSTKCYFSAILFMRVLAHDKID